MPLDHRWFRSWKLKYGLCSVPCQVPMLSVPSQQNGTKEQPRGKNKQRKDLWVCWHYKCYWFYKIFPLRGQWTDLIFCSWLRLWRHCLGHDRNIQRAMDLSQHILDTHHCLQGQIKPPGVENRSMYVVLGISTPLPFPRDVVWLWAQGLLGVWELLVSRRLFWQESSEKAQARREYLKEHWTRSWWLSFSSHCATN